MDCLTIAIAGYALEAAVGWAWMFCIFVAGALAGTVGSLVLTPPSATPLGTSGAIMAMLVSLFLISLRLSPGRARARIQALAAWAAVPALIPASIAAVAAQLDYGARVGGVVAGAAVGLLLLRTWRAESPLPRFQAGATVVAVLAALAFGGSAVAVARGYPAFLTRPGMVPLAEYPHTAAEVSWSSGRLLATYPRDPMAHVFASQEFWQRKDLAGAEREMRAALALAEASAAAFSPDLPNTLRVSLAAVLVARGRTPEARAVAHEPCVATGAAMPPARMAAVLRTYGLCKPPS
jgi:rhomboid protease GluP